MGKGVEELGRMDRDLNRVERGPNMSRQYSLNM